MLTIRGIYISLHVEIHKNRASIRVLKKILRFLVSFIAGIYLALLLLTSLPAFQRWSARVASDILEDKIGSPVSIERLRISPLGRITLSGVKVYDRQDTLMFQASRIAATLDILPLFKKKIRMDGVQVIGAKAIFYKEDDEKPCNFQFFIDAFSSKNSKKKIDLGLGILVLRRSEIRFDRLDRPPSPGTLNPSHLHLCDLNLTAKVLFRKSDTLSLDLRSLSFAEQSGLQVRHLSLKANAGKDRATIQGLRLELPRTTIQTEGQLVCPLPVRERPGEGLLESLSASGGLEGSICPRDLACLAGALASRGETVHLKARTELKDGTLRLPDLSLSESSADLSLLCDITAESRERKPSLGISIKELRTGPSLGQFLTENLQGQPKGPREILTRLGSTKTSGTARLQDGNLHASLLTESELGSVSVDGSLHDMQDIEAEVKATNILVGQLLNLQGKAKGTTASMEASISGNLPGKGKQAKISAKGFFKSLIFGGYEHLGIQYTAALGGGHFSGTLTKDEPNGQFSLTLQTAKQQGRRSLVCQMQLKDFDPHSMNLTKGYVGEQFSGELHAGFSDIDPGHPQGMLCLKGFEMVSRDKGTLRTGDITLRTGTADDGQHLLLESDFLNVKADGNINWRTLPASFIQPIRQAMPSLLSADDSQGKASAAGFHFHVEVQDTAIAERLLEANLRLPEKSTLDGTFSNATGLGTIEMQIPRLEVAGMQAQDIDCKVKARGTLLEASIEGVRLAKGKPTNIRLDAYAEADKVTSRLQWNTPGSTRNDGNISLTGLVSRDPAGQTAIDAKVNQSYVCIGDSIWSIKPATIKYHDRVIDVEDISISQADRHINIGGRVSPLTSDTLKAELRDIDISYIMDLVNFHKVDFDGQASGNMYATSLLGKPYADAFLKVRDFTFNAAEIGDLDLHADWGRQEGAITLDAEAKGPWPEHRTTIKGTIIPGKGKNGSLDLGILTSQIDLSFLSKYTRNIFTGMQGRASGWTHVFGAFNNVNVEGDMMVDELRTHIPALGTDYYLRGDSVIMRPDNIWLRGAHIYDYLGTPGMTEHTATVNAHLMHNAFKTLRYDVSIDAHNMFGYNFPHQGSMSFYGTVYADAQLHLGGDMKSVTIDIAASPMPGTTINYNTQTTGTVDEAEFVTYIDKATRPGTKQQGTPSDTGGNLQETPLKAASDIRINFDINANPNAQIRILMDPATGDNISLYGNGHLRAHYYNKGRFQLFGTYRIEEGNYRMSIRDVIRKDFTFLPDGTLIFSGDAMGAALNLTAKHTVPNVSLDDLSATGLGLSNTRVDCIMKIGGIASQPVISFDFDIPNANEDEKQMVRSMLSSEEERDMQAIYLLGVGRFYSYGSFIDKRQTQGGMAMNSVLSSALSSRFNQIMSQALGGTGWSIGTNLRTGEEGWERVDAEALVSGKMLSGRLQFNGNFGYRENKYKMGSNNFIGDFDIQYRLSPRSPFSLKAYNQTNDRYFTQSSLTTQGIGIKFQRDFNRWQELFRKAKKKKRKEQ